MWTVWDLDNKWQHSTEVCGHQTSHESLSRPLKAQFHLLDRWILKRQSHFPDFTGYDTIPYFIFEGNGPLPVKSTWVLPLLVWRRLPVTFY